MKQNLSEEALARKYRYSAQYQKENYTIVSLRCGNKADKDVIDCLNQQENKSEFLKKLIRDHIANS